MSDDDEHIAPVIALPFDERVPMRSSEHLPPRQCMHIHVAVSFKQRTLTCDDCGQSVDPFYFFDVIVRGWVRVTHYRREERRIRQSIEALKAEEKRVKARLRRAQAKEAKCRT